VVCAKSENDATALHGHRGADPCFSACLVEGDAAQRASQHRLRRRSVLISIALQITGLAALILAPIFSKTERIAMASNWVPMPPYHRSAAGPDHRAHRSRPVDDVHRFRFCPTCRAELPRVPHSGEDSPRADDSGAGVDIGDNSPACGECGGLTVNTNAQPVPPPVTSPHRLVLTHLDPAMLIRRVEPAYPILARQTRREGTVELRAIIATDGSVRSLQFVAGDAMFAASAIEAVGRWRYKPTYLNGAAVEVETQVTVIYRLNR
jgi:TonB family protein